MANIHDGKYGTGKPTLQRVRGRFKKRMSPVQRAAYDAARAEEAKMDEPAVALPAPEEDQTSAFEVVSEDKPEPKPKKTRTKYKKSTKKK